MVKGCRVSWSDDIKMQRLYTVANLEETPKPLPDLPGHLHLRDMPKHLDNHHHQCINVLELC